METYVQMVCVEWKSIREKVHICNGIQVSEYKQKGKKHVARVSLATHFSSLTVSAGPCPLVGHFFMAETVLIKSVERGWAVK